MRVTSKGQVTIPIEMRRKYGIGPNTEVEFVDGECGPEIVVKGEAGLTPGEQLIRRMRSAPWKPGLTTDQLMTLTRGWGEDDYSV